MAYTLKKLSDSAAYKVAIGATAEDAAKDGLGIVELNYTTNPPSPIYGRYDNAPDDGPIPVTVAKPADTEVIGGGSVGPVPPASGAGNKGDIVNQNDPFVHPVDGENIHADNSPPATVDPEAERAAAVEVAEQSIEDASKSTKKK